MEGKAHRLRQQVQAAECQLRDLKVQLQQAELEIKAAQQAVVDQGSETDSLPSDQGTSSLIEDTLTSFNTNKESWPLSATEYSRYGRQMILPEVGLPGQLRLKRSKVLIVGVGGLGCPAAAYLAGAGVGTLGLMDGDTVEVSNLHRQIAHSTRRVGKSKVDSAIEFLRSLNPAVQYIHHPFHLSPEQAVAIFEQYDLVLDCTDHPTSRYLISDACVLTEKTLVSASALKTDGQLMVLNDPPQPTGDVTGGPCYRCIFPKPPPAESVLSCGEGGILGPVVGVMGVMQALEAIKLLTRRFESQEQTPQIAAVPQEPPRASLLMFSAYNNPQFRTVRLRSRRKDCAVCSVNSYITKESLTSGSLDYIAFCGRTASVNVLPAEFRVTASDFAKEIRNASTVLIDVRDETQFAICALPNSVSVPWTGNDVSWLAKAQESGVLDSSSLPTYLVCRFGNDSQLAAKALLDRSPHGAAVRDMSGGLEAWRNEVDSSWPEY